MSLLTDELRQKKTTTFANISLPTKRRMIEIYEVLAKALPSDPAARQYRHLVASATSPRLVQEVREVLRTLTQLAKLEKARAEKNAAESPNQFTKNLTGDDLTARYVREAAAVVSEFQTPDASEAMLLALGIFMDTEGVLRSFPMTSELVSQIESDQARNDRLSMLGKPTMRNRADLAKHFFVSAHLVAAMGGDTARGIGLGKESLDSNDGSGFSFVDMAANRAGIIFAEKILAKNIDLEQVADGFTVNRYLPEVADLAEGIQGEELRSQLGKDDLALHAKLEKIEQRIFDSANLPVALVLFTVFQRKLFAKVGRLLARFAAATIPDSDAVELSGNLRRSRKSCDKLWFRELSRWGELVWNVRGIWLSPKVAGRVVLLTAHCKEL